MKRYDSGNSNASFAKPCRYQGVFLRHVIGGQISMIFANTSLLD
jgi:hypothetical protein